MKKNYYKILGLTPSADLDKIRRAYRSLARRYHPDINSDEKAAIIFKDITEAYNTLRNPQKRAKYDVEFSFAQYQQVDARFKAYTSFKKNMDTEQSWRAPSDRRSDQKEVPPKKTHAYQQERKIEKEPAELVLQEFPFTKISAWFKRAFTTKDSNREKNIRDKTQQKRVIKELSVLELKISLREAIYGAKRAITIPDEVSKCVGNIVIPAGTRAASVLRIKYGPHKNNEALCIIKSIERHPYLSLEEDGLVMNVPLTISEAIAGVTLKVPTLNGEAELKIPPNTNSGTRIRLKNKGVKKGSEREDLFVQVMIVVPESALAVGIKEKSTELDRYYEKGVRSEFDSSISEVLQK